MEVPYIQSPHKRGRLDQDTAVLPIDIQSPHKRGRRLFDISRQKRVIQSPHKRGRLWLRQDLNH